MSRVREAVKTGLVAKVRGALKAGGSVEESDEKDRTTPLVTAIEGKHEEVALMLSELGATVPEGRACLATAVKNGLVSVAETIIRGRVCDLEEKDLYGSTPLHYAARYGHASVAELLIKAGCKLDEKSKSEWTPLHYAASDGRESVAELLIKAGCKLDEKDNSGWTPLHYAASDGRASVAELLIKAGCKLDEKSIGEWTPLHYAAAHGRLATIELLLKSGCSWTILNNERDLIKQPFH